ncbi:hypothetical protein RIF29_10573 [Crotalaria pallida]|uniref:DNA-directed RNA polymerase n=1 Tax=Crotalaria pallida TaxID=3830 RepID=A0AAN9FVD1_CROPI
MESELLQQGTLPCLGANSSSLSDCACLSPIIAGNESLFCSILIPLGFDRDVIGDFFTKFDGGLVNLKSDTCFILKIDRKLVKQTVMTSVYGVTYIGAREQIKRRLEEKGLITDDKLLFSASCYAAKLIMALVQYYVTLAALGEVFEAARGIMGWLGDCAKVIAYENQAVRWTTPLGLPVVQPYCKTERHLVE